MTIPDPSKLRRMLNASIGTKKLQPASRVEVLDDLIPKVQNLLDSKNINIKLPSFEASRYERYSVSKTDAEFVMKNTDGDKMAIPTAIRLLKVAGYNPKIVKQLMEAFPVTKLRRARGKSKTAQRSNVQVAKGRVPPPKSKSRSSSPAEKRGAVEAESDRERQAERRKANERPARPRSPSTKPKKPRTTSPKGGKPTLPRTGDKRRVQVGANEGPYIRQSRRRTS
jgi:ribosomal protein S10